MNSQSRTYSRKSRGVGILLSAMCLGLLAFGQGRDTYLPTAGPPDYDLSWYTVDCGGVMFSTGDDYELSATIGQPDAGVPMIGGDFELNGGFWVSSTLPRVQVMSSQPACDKSLWRTQNNFVLVTFNGPIVNPLPGQVLIQEILDGGVVGPDLSPDFVFTVEGGGSVLRITENGDTPLTHRHWYRFANTGDWPGVAVFERDYVVQVGDSTNDGLVVGADFSFVNTGITCFNCPDDRRDINGDNFILGADASLVNASIASFPVVKPTGHTCTP